MNRVVRCVRCAPIVVALATLLAVETGEWGDSSAAGAQSPTSAKPLFPRITVTRGDRSSPMIALTFDDAPHPAIVPRLLALLRAEKVEATFFLVGSQVKNFPSLAREIAEEKHEIGNHSMSHLNLRKGGREAVDKEILGMQALLKDRLGVVPTTFRPAYGFVNTGVKDVCEEAGLDIILWDVDTNDWRSGATSKTIISEVLDHVGSGSIVLFHATRQRSVDAVRELIPVLRYRGFKFVTCSELLRERRRREEIRRTLPGSPGAADRPTTPQGMGGEPEPETDPLPPIDRPRLPRL